MNREELEEQQQFCEEKIESLKEAKKNVENLIYLNQTLDLDWDFESLSNELSRNIKDCENELDNISDSFEDIDDNTNEYLEVEYWRSQF